MKPSSSFRYNNKTDVCYRRLAFLGFPLYRVGDDGSVWRLYKWKKGRVFCRHWRRRRQTGGKYLHVIITNRNPRRYSILQVHRLVLTAFAGPCPEGMECRHFPDRDTRNNRLENLRWGTHQQNLKDREYHNTRNDVPSPGSKNGNSKFTEEMIPLIRSWASQGHGPTEIARRVQKKWNVAVTPEATAHIVKGRSWKHVI